MQLRIKDIEPKYIGKQITTNGWIKSCRQQKSFAFITINDGSCFHSLQIIVQDSLENYDAVIKDCLTGASINVVGTVTQSQGAEQAVELQATKVSIIGTSEGDTYPLQKKHHSFEFLRTIPHLRPRTNTLGAVARVRSRLSYATHQFFQERGFLYFHAPIITSLDCEGAGELFNVTTLNPLLAYKNFDNDFFGKPGYLTVSGQLNAEAYACALHSVYTFGPTFRAENSNTTRHLAEFWMIEPEIAFAQFEDVIRCAHEYLVFCVKQALEYCAEDMQFFDSMIRKGLIDDLTRFVNAEKQTITYTEVIDILKKSGKKFEHPVEWGINLQTEHERFIAEEHCKGPVAIINYPAAIKAFYMRANDDGKTVAAMDMIVPGIGEIIGGAAREERYDVLKQKMVTAGLDISMYQWYLDLRRYGTVPHGGFGLGFERLVQFVTGMENIRDVIPFPRYPNHLEY